MSLLADMLEKVRRESAADPSIPPALNEVVEKGRFRRVPPTLWIGGAAGIGLVAISLFLYGSGGQESFSPSDFSPVGYLATHDGTGEMAASQPAVTRRSTGKAAQNGPTGKEAASDAPSGASVTRKAVARSVTRSAVKKKARSVSKKPSSPVPAAEKAGRGQTTHTPKRPPADPAEIASYVYRAQELEAAGLLHDAVATYGEALERAPDSPDLNNTLAYLLLKLGEPRAAYEAASRVLRTDPADTDALVNAGVARAAMSDAADAEAYFQKALQGNRRVPKALFNLAFLYEREDRKAEALQLLEELARTGVPGTGPHMERIRKAMKHKKGSETIEKEIAGG